MISHLSIQQRHAISGGMWHITDRGERFSLRWVYRMARREGASPFTCRAMIGIALRAGRFHGSYEPSQERAA